MVPFEIATSHTRRLPALENDILKVLLYFDVFRFPLTVSEIYHFLPSNSITPSDVATALLAPSLQEKVESKNGYFFLTASTGSYADERQEKERRAARLLKIARVMGKLIRIFPYVRGVFLSGELSKGIVSEKGDIDFVVVTQEGRLLITMTLLIMFKKVFLLYRKRFFCLNHFVSEHHLQVQIRNIYSATEVATLMPLENDMMFSRYMLSNLWITQFFPNWKIDERLLRSDRRGTSVVRNTFEEMMPDRIADRLDRWLMAQWQRLWRTRYANLSDEERNRKYHCSEYLSTAYGEDYQDTILRSFDARLHEHDII